MLNRTILLIAAELVLFSYSGIAEAQTCDEDTIQTVSSDGSILILESGAVYQVENGDEVDTALWLASEDVVVCEDEIINKDENGERASVTRLR